MKYISYLLYKFFNVVPNASDIVYVLSKEQVKKQKKKLNVSKQTVLSHLRIINYKNRGFVHYQDDNNCIDLLVPWLESKGYKVTRSPYNTTEITISL